MKQISTILTALVVLFLTSCNNQAKQADTGAAKLVSSLQPYKAMMIQHTVKDFDTWYQVFKATDSLPKAAGLSEPGVGRGLDDDKMVIVINTASDIQKAKDFAASPALKDAMDKAGVTSAPTISYLDVIFDDTSHIAQQERLMVTHHVKDFDTWKKAFDAEGSDVRAANGLVERLMARSGDDSNTVTLMFAITDMTKAKARVASPELKKIMTDGGVDGPVQATWFKWVNM